MSDSRNESASPRALVPFAIGGQSTRTARRAAGAAGQPAPRALPTAPVMSGAEVLALRWRGSGELRLWDRELRSGRPLRAGPSSDQATLPPAEAAEAPTVAGRAAPEGPAVRPRPGRPCPPGRCRQEPWTCWSPDCPTLAALALDAGACRVVAAPRALAGVTRSRGPAAGGLAALLLDRRRALSADRQRTDAAERCAAAAHERHGGDHGGRLAGHGGAHLERRRGHGAERPRRVLGPGAGALGAVAGEAATGKGRQGQKAAARAAMLVRCSMGSTPSSRARRRQWEQRRAWRSRRRRSRSDSMPSASGR